MAGTHIITSTGSKIDYVNPDYTQFHLDDFLRSMCRERRFANQADWNVTAHSLLVSYISLFAPFEDLASDPAYQQVRGLNYFQNWVLFHDYHEGATRDVPTPLKKVLGDAIKQVEERLDAAIAKAHNLILPSPLEETVKKKADNLAFIVERYHFFTWSRGESDIDGVDLITLPASSGDRTQEVLDMVVRLSEMSEDQLKLHFYLVHRCLQENKSARDVFLLGKEKLLDFLLRNF